MKKLLLLALLCFSKLIFAQEPTIDKVQNIDSMLVHVDMQGLNSGFLYDRIAGLSNLKSFNQQTNNIATLNVFEQALQDLYKSSNQKLFESYEVSRTKYPDKEKFDRVAIGGIIARFQGINYNEDSIESSGLKITDNMFYSQNGKKAFKDYNIVLFAPLLDYAMGNEITYEFKKELLYEASDKKIKSMTVDFGTNQTYQVYKNGDYVQKTISIKYNTEGYKTITFKILFEDGSNIETFGKLHVKIPVEGTNRNVSAIDNIIGFSSTIPFQGYDETSPKYGKLDYRIFYRTNGGNTQKTLKKPLIILDGFDPGDGRKIQDGDSPKPANLHNSIEEMMVYGPTKIPMIPLLTEQGFDVIVVNFPTYWSSGVRIDGGADFIERNAMTVVSLIKSLNTRLAIGGRMGIDGRPLPNSDQRLESLVIVGPSMGGQISRYALAYMEKKLQETNNNDWNHRTRLWISVDSPHLGANIPMGVQTLLNVLKDNSDSVGAADFVNNWLGSAAAKQQLIEQYSGQQQVGPFLSVDIKADYLDAKTTGQGFPIDRGHPFFIQYYNNLFNNGLANSKGYPQQTRRIAIANGSVMGNKNFDNPYLPLSTDFSGTIFPDNFPADGTQVFKVEGDANIIGHIVTLETYFMASPNSYGKLAYFKTKKVLGWDHYNRFGTNINSRGNMDNVPGGWFPAQKDIAESVLSESPGTSVFGDFTNWSIVVNDWHLLELKHVGSFIPTMSSLGYKNPNTSWNQNLSRNLVCSNEIPFNSYFGPDKNEPHTSFTQKSYNWLIEELAGRAQQPNFTVGSAKLIGQLCNGSGTFSFESCSTPGNVQTWLTSSNIQTVSSDGNSISVTSAANYQGQGWIKATFFNGVTVTKTFWIGKPKYTLNLVNNPDLYNKAEFNLEGINGSIYDQQISSIVWTKVGGGGYLHAAPNNYDGWANGPGNTWVMHIKVDVTNACGTVTQYYDITPPPPGLPCDRISSFEVKGFENDKYKVIENRSVPPDPCLRYSDDEDTTTMNNISIKVYDFTGVLVNASNSDEVDLSSLKTGMYVIKAFVNDKIILTKKIGIQ